MQQAVHDADGTEQHDQEQRARRVVDAGVSVAEGVQSSGRPSRRARERPEDTQRSGQRACEDRPGRDQNEEREHVGPRDEQCTDEQDEGPQTNPKRPRHGALRRPRRSDAGEQERRALEGEVHRACARRRSWAAARHTRPVLVGGQKGPNEAARKGDTGPGAEEGDEHEGGRVAGEHRA